ncbi:UNVERIFIED_CONTAM: hypothetical protein NCL1_11107 [Trichonephila clavipes]
MYTQHKKNTTGNNKTVSNLTADHAILDEQSYFFNCNTSPISIHPDGTFLTLVNTLKNIKYPHSKHHDKYHKFSHNPILALEKNRESIDNLLQVPMDEHARSRNFYWFDFSRKHFCFATISSTARTGNELIRPISVTNVKNAKIYAADLKYLLLRENTFWFYYRN